MRKLNRYSEPYQATGNVAGEGVLNLLGRPGLQPLELLVREALQNSWDAASDPGNAPVQIRVTSTPLSGPQLSILTAKVLADPPKRVPLGDAIKGSPRLLHFSDRRTVGLSVSHPRRRSHKRTN